MSLSERLQGEKPRRTKRGCESCIWTAQLPTEDQQAIREWIEASWSIRQLHKICATDPDNPLRISVSAFKNHIRDCLGLR